MDTSKYVFCPRAGNVIALNVITAILASWQAFFIALRYSQKISPLRHIREARGFRTGDYD